MLSVLAGIAVLTVASYAIEAALNPLLLRLFPEALAGPEAPSSNPWGRTPMFAYWLMCVAAGGYVAARVARRQPVQHAAAMGIISVRSNDNGKVVAGREPRFTIGVDHHCHPNHTCTTGGRSSLQTPQTQ